MFKEMRRKDREMSRDAAMEILNNGKYGVMAVVGDDGYPYGIPLHYVVIDGELYFHSAADGGHKTECFTHNPKASFTVIETEDGVKSKSAILFGTVELMPDMHVTVLEKMVEKFVPPFAWEQAKSGAQFAQNGIIAYRIKADHMTAKWIDKPEQKQ